MVRNFWMAVACVVGCGLSSARADIFIGGHADVGAAFDNGQLVLHFHIESDAQGGGGAVIPAGEYAPTDLLAGVPDPAIARPAGNQWDFLGAPTDSVWFLPQSSDPNKPFLGLGLEDLNPADWSGPLTWTLVGFNGPAGGNFSLWQNGSFGNPVPFMTTSNGITSADKVTQNAGGHEHFNWGFTRAGVFEIQFQISGTHVTLGSLTDTATFTFVSAVPEPSSMALLACVGTASVFGWMRRKRSASGGNGPSH